MYLTVRLNRLFFVIFILYTGFFCKSSTKKIHKIIDQRIAGGSFTESPYCVLIRIVQSDGAMTLCTGTILSVSIVLTAGHCLVKKGISNVFVTGGLSAIRANLFTQRRVVIDIVIHEHFNKFFKNNNDVALLYVDKPFEFNVRVNKINIMAGSAWMQPNTTLELAGWGKEEPDLPIREKHLKKVNVVYLSQQDTLLKYNQRTLHDGIVLFDDQNTYEIRKKDDALQYIMTVLKSDNLFCSMGKERPIDGSCHGDSGGPVTWEGYQVGVISFGVGNNCGDPYRFQCHMKLERYSSWIINATRRLYMKHCSQIFKIPV